MYSNSLYQNKCEVIKPQIREINEMKFSKAIKVHFLAKRSANW